MLGAMSGLISGSCGNPATTGTSTSDSAIVRVIVATETPTGIGYTAGSGFFVNAIHVVTNEHVVAGSGSSPELFVMFAGEDTPEAVELSWSNPDLDVAVLRYRGSTPRAELTLAAPDPARGSEVFALGYPGPADTASLGGAASSTLTEGILSRAPFRAQWGSTGTAGVRVLQHTAAINPGSSGGPLVDACGAVVGINTSGAPSELRDADGDLIGTTAAQGIFFALAASELRSELQRHGVDFSLGEECESEAHAFPSPSLTVGLVVAAFVAAGAWLAFRHAPPIASGEPVRQPAGTPAGTAGPPATPPPGAEAGRPADGRPAPPPTTARFTGRSGTADLTVPVPALKGARHGISFGRNPHLVDRVLSDPALSRRHFRVSLAGGRLFVEDLGSTHGTFVNGQRLKPYHARRLDDGDSVRAGGGEWRFTAERSG